MLAVNGQSMGSDLPAAGLLLVPSVVGSVLGMINGAAPAAKAYREGTAIAGSLHGPDASSGKGVTFSLEGSAPIDLSAHANAAVSKAAATTKKSLEDGLIGVGKMLGSMVVGTLGVALLFFPVLIPAFVAARDHEVLNRRTAIPVIAVGAGISLFIISSILTGIIVVTQVWPLFLLQAGIGALWGLYVLPRLRTLNAAEAAASGQWWAAAEKALSSR